MDRIIVVDIEKCLACKSCEIACALVHSKSKILEEAVAESPRPRRMLDVERAGEFAVPIQCRHCEDAPCVAICPTGALSQQDGLGPVIVERELCIGCKLCIMVCPFGVLRIGDEGRAVIKCDMCGERLKKGEEPACVEACITGALRLVSLEEAARGKRARASAKLAAQTRRAKDKKEE